MQTPSIQQVSDKGEQMAAKGHSNKYGFAFDQFDRSVPVCLTDGDGESTQSRLNGMVQWG